MSENARRKLSRTRLRNAHFKRPLRFERLEDRSLLAAIITVNSTADGDIRDDDLTLREAILVSNDALAFATLTAAEQAQVTGTLSSGDTIGFNISNADVVKTITLASALPTIADAVILDGYTQPGASANTLAAGNNSVHLIELNGVNRSFSGFVIGSTGGGSTIRGLVINRFSFGIEVNSGNNVVEGNFIGIDPTGNTALGNSVGVHVTTGANNLIGATTPQARNVISANVAGGAGNVLVDGLVDFQGNPTAPFPSGTLIRGNYIGTNAAGLAGFFTGEFGNTHGVVVLRSTGTIIGGSDADDLLEDGNVGARNVISGNFNGIRTDEVGTTYAASLTVQGNFIGVDATGNVALGNFGNGIFFSPQRERSDNSITVGGTAAGAGNVISGNTAVGVLIANSNVMMQGNRIGTNLAGTLDLGNGNAGVELTRGGSPPFPVVQFTVGGATPAARNIISGNGGFGLRVNNLSGSVTVQGNYIGTQGDGFSPLGNDSDGIFAQEAEGGGTIGGTNIGEGNVIAFNGAGVFGGAGINIPSATGITILGNSIFSNRGLGIDLFGNGVTSNDAPANEDSDTGPNNLQNFPVITLVTGINIFAALNSLPSTIFRVEFFASDTTASGFTEGQTFLGFTNVTTGGDGNADPFAFSSPISLAGKFVSATATRRSVSGPAIETSEFSASMAVGGGPLPTLTVTGGSVLEGNPGGDQKVPFILSLSAVSGVAVSGTVSTSLGAGGPAANEGMDFVSADGVAFTIPAGQTQTTVFVSIIEDTTAEQLEQFLLTAVADTVSNLDGAATGTGTIQNDDTAFFSINDMTVNEGAGLLTFTVSLSNPIDIDMPVNVSYSDVTTSLGDFVHISTSLIFPENSTAPQTVGVSITNDSIVESTETFLASLTADSNSSTGRSIDTSDTGIGTITDNDTAVIAPTVTINQAAGQADPTSTSPIQFTVMFSTPVTGFTADDLSFQGSTLGSLLASVSGSGANYTVSVQGMTGNGTVVASIGAGAAVDASNTPSAASTSIDNSVTFTAAVVAPTVTIDQAAGQADPTSTGPVQFTVVFSTPVTGFTGSDVLFAGSTVGGALVAGVSGSGVNYTVSVTGMTGGGTVVASIGSGAAVNASNSSSAASTSIDNTVTVPVPVPQAMTLTITLVARQAKFKNEFGLYFVDDAAGRIGTLVPGDAGYARAAIGRTKAVFATRDKIGAKRTVNLPAGGFYGTYLVQNATRSQFLARNPFNRLSKKPLMFFSFAAANPDGFDHVRRPLTTRFAFEDQTRGGDRDFNDSVVDVQARAASLADLLNTIQPAKRK